MKVTTKIASRFLACIALCTVILMMNVSCQREVNPETLDSNGIITFNGSISDLNQNEASSRLTPSTSTQAGVFEVGDTVGFYLFDQKSPATPTYRNVRYEAKRVVDQGAISLHFEPTYVETAPYYKSFNLHNVISYFPYDWSDKSYDAGEFIFSVKTDQSRTYDLMASDFMTARHFDVKPQQNYASENTAPLDMTFKHQMTSVVVKIRNVDDVPFSGAITVTVENTNTLVKIDMISDKDKVVLSSGGSNINPVTLQSLGTYTEDGYNGQMCFRGIVVPQRVIENSPLIKIKIGTGLSGRVFEYKPKTGDAFYDNAGLIQGAEHVFDFVISGTQLELAGGDIVPWGTGVVQKETVDGGGKQLLKMNFEILNPTPDNETTLGTLSNAILAIDGKNYSSTRVHYDNIGKILEVYYYQDNNWGYYLEKASFLDANQITRLTLTPTNPLRITGNPAQTDYSNVVGVVDFDNATIIEK